MENEQKIKIAMYGTQDNDILYFNKANTDGRYEIDYYEEQLNPDTTNLAAGHDAVCVFTNDIVSGEVVRKLASEGVKAVALRCAGYNNVELDATHPIMPIANVSNYSPYSVAEHAIALLLTSVRRIHKAYNRTREFNFDLDDLVGFELHGKTIGVIGTGKIGKKFVDICNGFGMNVIAYDKFPDKIVGLIM